MSTPPDSVHRLAGHVAGREDEFLRFLRMKLARQWRATARPEQLPPDGDWQTLFLRGGRGAGKSWASSHLLVELIAEDPLRDREGPGQWAVVAPTFADVRDTCVESSECGLLAAFGTNLPEVAAGRSLLVAGWNRSLGELRLHDGSVIFCDSADDGATTIQGKNLRGAWLEEIGLWRQWEKAYDESLEFALRKGQARLIASGTPKADMPARTLVRRLLEDPGVVNRRLRTLDNAANLSPQFIDTARRRHGTRLAMQELEGELLEDVEGALWEREWLDGRRVDEAPELRRAIVGLDPAGGQGSSAQGLVLVGEGIDGRAYVLRAEALHRTPLAFLTHAVRVADEHSARMVVEANYGDRFLGTLVEQAIAHGGRRVAYEMITARTSKETRAESAAGLYERGLVSHVGYLGDLEDQLLTFTGRAGEPSDLVDALGHALAHLDRYGLGRSLSLVGREHDLAAVPYK